MVATRFVPAQSGGFEGPTEDSADRTESEYGLPPGADQLVSDIGVVLIGWDQPINAKLFNHHPPPLGG